MSIDRMDEILTNGTDTIDDKYIDSYADLQVHQVMLEDVERLKSYKAAIMNNQTYFDGKVVMDVGAGSGILSIFCAMAGAKKVYAVEASNVASIANVVIKDNNFEDVIDVIQSKVEDISPSQIEKVDIIISEWMGFYLLHEGMLDSIIYARDTFLKPNGYIFPESATILMAPCSVPSVHNFWKNVHGVNMTSLGSLIRKSKCHKPEVLQVKSHEILSEEVVFTWIDIKDVTIEELNQFSMKHVACASRDGSYHGIAIWFDCQFPVIGEDNITEPVILSTSPYNPITHWKQTVIILPEEINIEKGQPVSWELTMKRCEENDRRYDLQLSLLDPEDETHPLPCDCYFTKCIITKKYLQDYPNNPDMDDTSAIEELKEDKNSNI